MAWDYKAFTCSGDELEARLKEFGADGWRLHTCEPFVIVGHAGIGTVHFAVVMDKTLPGKNRVLEPVETAEDGNPVVKREPIGARATGAQPSGSSPNGGMRMR